MKAHSEITLTAAEVDYAHGALAYFIDGMQKYQQWIRDKDGKPLPGMDVAVKEIQKDVSDMTKLQLRFYDTCFAPKKPE